MGPQPSSLNCKLNEVNEKHEVTANKDFFTRQFKSKQLTQMSNNSESLSTENVIGNKSPPPDLTRATSDRNISVKQSRQAVKQKIFIPEHQSLTKVSQSQFKSSIKDKKFYVQDKTKSLAQIIEPRYYTMKHFPYSQILALTESLVYGLAYMTKKNCNHHDFYPTNIYFIDGKFKIINPLEIQASGFYLTSQRKSSIKSGQRFSFLSPQLIIAILEEVTQNQIGQQNLGKADIFAIGMILLEVCCLQPSSDCYDAESYNIVDSVIRQRVAKVAKVYTPIMAECINLMLQYEVERRIDPITLGQLIHWKVENQKIVAMQMQAPKPPAPLPQQMQIGPNVRGIVPMPPGMPPNIIPQQIRGPPPPYIHQPFKMQNLNQNVIAVTVPNEQFTRIGPNNQGFLSSSSLQQKLRVIELIKQHPEQDDDVECESRIQQVTQRRQQQKKQNPNIDLKSIQKRVTLQKEQQIKPQYPFVESIYSQKPLVEGITEYDQNQKNKQPMSVPLLITNENKQFITQPVVQSRGAPKISLSKENLLQVNNNIQKSIPTTYQYMQLQQKNKYIQPKSQNETKMLQKLEDRSVETFSNEQIPSPINTVYQQKTTKLVSGQSSTTNQEQKSYELRSKLIEPPLQYQPLFRGKIQTQTFVSSYSYNKTVTSNPSKVSSMVTNIYSTQEQSNSQKKLPTMPQNQTPSYSKKYGTSFQKLPSEGQSIEQRVQRVLNMSRNAK